MSEQVLSLDKIEHLKSLGIEMPKGSFHYCVYSNNSQNLNVSHTEGEYPYIALTVKDLLDMLPNTIMYPCKDDTYTCVLTIQTDTIGDSIFDLEIYYINSYFGDESERFSISKLGWCEALYQMLCWLNKNNCL